MSSAVATRRCIAILACVFAAASASADPIDHWVVTPTLSASHLDNGRDDWRGAELDVLYKVKIYIGWFASTPIH